MIRERLRQGWAMVGFGRLHTLSLVALSQGFIAAAFFLQMVLLARLLPAAEFGHLATILAIATVMEAAIGARGAETALGALAQIPANDPAARLALTARLLRIDFLWSLSLYTALAGAVLAYDFITGARSGWLVILMAGSFLAFPWGTIKSYLTLFQGSRAFPLVETPYAAITLFVGAGLSALYGGIGFVVGMVLASLTRTVLGLRQSGLSLGMIAHGGGNDAILPPGTLARLGATGSVRSGLLNLAMQMDILVLAAATSPAAVGLYRAAKTLSSLVQRLPQPIWFVLRRHIIVGVRGEGDAHSRRVVIAASLGFAVAGAVVVPAIVYFAGDIAAFAFGPDYRGAAEPLRWLLPAAWVLYAVTGWSSMFGSITDKRFTVIGIYSVQIALFAAAAVLSGITPSSLALALALSQLFVAGSFWLMFLRRAPA